MLSITRWQCNQLSLRQPRGKHEGQYYTADQQAIFMDTIMNTHLVTHANRLLTS